MTSSPLKDPWGLSIVSLLGCYTNVGHCEGLPMGLSIVSLFSCYTNVGHHEGLPMGLSIVSLLGYFTNVGHCEGLLMGICTTERPLGTIPSELAWLLYKCWAL